MIEDQLAAKDLDVVERQRSSSVDPNRRNTGPLSRRNNLSRAIRPNHMKDLDKAIAEDGGTEDHHNLRLLPQEPPIAASQSQNDEMIGTLEGKAAGLIPQKLLDEAGPGDANFLIFDESIGKGHKTPQTRLNRDLTSEHIMSEVKSEAQGIFENPHEAQLPGIFFKQVYGANSRDQEKPKPQLEA